MGSLLDPTVGDDVGGISGIANNSLGDSFKSRRRVVLKLDHRTVVGFDAISFGTLDVGGGGGFVNNEFSGSLHIQRLCLVEEVDVEATEGIIEQAVDVLQSLVV